MKNHNLILKQNKLFCIECDKVLKNYGAERVVICSS